jgi:hypothetical protein
MSRPPRPDQGRALLPRFRAAIEGFAPYLQARIAATLGRNEWASANSNQIGLSR